MELGLGQRYSVSVDNLTFPNASGITVGGGTNCLDLLMFAPAAGVPLYLEHLIVTSAATAAAIQRLQILKRSTASTGGTAVTPKNFSSAGPTASCTVTYNNVTTLGTLIANSQIDSQQWNEFAPYEYDIRPSGLICTPSEFLCLFVPQGPSSTFLASLRAEFLEVK